ADREDDQRLHPGAGGQPPVVVQRRVDRFEDEEGYLVVAPELFAEGQGGVRLTGPGGTDEERVPGERGQAHPERAGRPVGDELAAQSYRWAVRPVVAL